MKIWDVIFNYTLICKLLGKKDWHTKMINLEYTRIEMQDYLKDQKVTPVQANILFKFRIIM